MKNKVLLAQVIDWARKNPGGHPDDCPLRFQNANFRRKYVAAARAAIRKEGKNASAKKSLEQLTGRSHHTNTLLAMGLAKLRGDHLLVDA